ncbi:hypothetical protein SDJN03_12080, partial [Cucurbita argyrosperma subsp. sororia]
MNHKVDGKVLENQNSSHSWSSSAAVFKTGDSENLLNGTGTIIVLTSFKMHKGEKGIMCIGFLKRAREEKETAKDRIVNDLQDLESQKQELERLLISETV